ncbi:MAG TPA: oligopeptide/dipeptide ABC transporter ATP-binding protein [Rectinemataceae bacterium]|nr:oligopeptide/dipeptide ABC transporter ATP-binding protein [Rectinemataceae bacterium]
MGEDLLVRVRDLKMHFQVGRGLSLSKARVRAVDGVSFDIRRGETLGLVGESGCGKSTLGRTILGLYKASAGSVRFEDVEITSRSRAGMKGLRRKMQLIFQDPSASLNSRRTVGQILLEPFIIHRIGTKAERRAAVAELVERVGLSSWHLSRYPHEMSGGQKQRVGIARALALRPGFIVCDEAVSALDVSIQAQIINLLEDLQADYGLTYLFISHNLSVVHHVSDRVGVMYLGKIVELGSHEDIYRGAFHPYTKALLAAVPVADPERRPTGRLLLAGDVPSPVAPPRGCRFHTRCPSAMELCGRVEPELREIGTGHSVACHLGDVTGREGAEHR